MYNNPLNIGKAISKNTNRINTLRLMFANDVMSRTNLASFLGISTAAVTAIVNEFIESGLLYQYEDPIDSSQKKAGRKQLPLSINYDWKYIVAIDIHPESIRIAVTNLAGRLLCEDSFHFSPGHGMKEFCSELSKDCIKLLWNNEIQLNQILGAGVTVIGPVDHLHGIALQPYRLFDQPLPIKEYLQTELPFPIAVESNVCAFLQSELLYRKNIGNAQNILMLKWGPGVGSATAISGQIYKGYNFHSSEIGHSYLSKEKGKKCSCGRNGCLETVISQDCILKQIRTFLHDKKNAELQQLYSEAGEPSAENLRRYLECPTPALETYLDGCILSLAEATSNAISILAPDKLILFGNLFESDVIVENFKNHLLELNPHLPRHFCIQSTFRHQKRYIGAAAIAIESFLFT